MSNVKEVHIKGFMPYNSYEHEDLNRKLGLLNSPSIGIRITYFPGEKYVKVGKGNLCLVPFEITGQEALSDTFFTTLCDLVKKAKGEITHAQLIDVENSELIF